MLPSSACSPPLLITISLIQIARLVKEAEAKWKKEAESARAHAGALEAQLLKVIRQQTNDKV